MTGQRGDDPVTSDVPLPPDSVLGERAARKQASPTKRISAAKKAAAPKSTTAAKRTATARKTVAVKSPGAGKRTTTAKKASAVKPTAAAKRTAAPTATAAEDAARTSPAVASSEATEPPGAPSPPPREAASTPPPPDPAPPSSPPYPPLPPQYQPPSPHQQYPPQQDPPQQYPPPYQAPPPPYGPQPTGAWPAPAQPYPPAGPPSQRRGPRPLVVIGAVAGGLLVLIAVLVLAVAVFGSDSDDEFTRVDDPVETPADARDESADDGPAVSLAAIFTAPGYTFVDVPEATEAARSAMESQLSGEYEGLVEDFAARRADKNDEPVAFVAAMLMPSLEEAGSSDEVANEFLEGAEEDMVSPERITVGGQEAVFGTAEGVQMMLVYKNGVALVVAGPGSQSEFEALTADLLGQIP